MCKSDFQTAEAKAKKQRLVPYLRYFKCQLIDVDQLQQQGCYPTSDPDHGDAGEVCLLQAYEHFPGCLPAK